MKKVIQEEIYLDAKITDIFRLIENYENYEKFVPGCKSSSKKVISESVSQGTLNFEFLNKRYRFVSLNNSSEDRIQMKQLEGPFKSFFAHWKIESIGALKTKVQFYAEFETSFVMSVILNDFMINNLKDLMIKTLKKQLNV
ncbi:hypothetical protein M9B41_01160 [SAR86 cluster bacterium]|nr:hypothetical protein M9B41_01160 [SAR86 cluster bacterium]